MSGRRQRILALALAAAGAGTLGGSAVGLAETDRQLTTAAAEVRLAEARDADCPAPKRERSSEQPRPEL